MKSGTGWKPGRAVVTGTGGLGLEVGVALVSAGWHVTLAGRNPAKGSAAVAHLKAVCPDAQADFRQADLASLNSVRALCQGLLEEGKPLDLLVNNAGIMSPPRRKVTEDGFEAQFGVNHLAHFALTAGLLPLLRSSEAPRVVSVTSLAMHHGRIDFDDLQSVRRYRPGIAYCQSKLAQAMFARQLQRESEAGGWNLRSIAAHPGFASTNIFSADTGKRTVMSVLSRLVIAPLVGQSAADGARPIVVAATSSDVSGGGLIGPGGFMGLRGVPGPCRFASAVDDVALTERLWDVSCALAGIDFASAPGRPRAH